MKMLSPRPPVPLAEVKLEAEGGVDSAHKNDELRHRRELWPDVRRRAVQQVDVSDCWREDRVKAVRAHVVQ